VGAEVFTGLVETVGTVIQADHAPDALHLRIEAPSIMSDVRVDHSISVNGCCLTVTECDQNTFAATAVAETLRKTTLGNLAVGSRVNLERAVRVGDRLGGHLVQGHVDVVGTITAVQHNNAGAEIWISMPSSFRPLIIPTGSIAVDGISLTIADLSSPDREGAWFKVAIIPHTLAVTNIGMLGQGALVNLEFDMMGKYALQRS
jgi:riboflavin synthase